MNSKTDQINEIDRQIAELQNKKVQLVRLTPTEVEDKKAQIEALMEELTAYADLTGEKITFNCDGIETYYPTNWDSSNC